MAYSTISKPGLHFNTKLFTGNGSTQSITGVGFQPDWVWFKNRSSSQNHRLFDAVRGAGKNLKSNDTTAEIDAGTGTDGQLRTFDSDGFSVGSDGSVNNNGENIVSWNWKANGAGSSNSDGAITSTVSANTTAGFSIVTYTGTGSTTTVGHGLGVKPDIVIYKELNNENAWRVMTDVSGTLKRIYLNATDAEASIIDSSTAPTSTVLNIGTGSEVNRSSGTFVAYCFASIKGFSKFGTYTGNGNADGPMIYTGFKPAFFLMKEVTDTGTNWLMYDNKRTVAGNPNTKVIYPNLTNSEGTGLDWDFLSNGVKCRNNNGGVNGNTNAYIYMAFAEEPLVANVGASIPATAR